MIKKMIKGGNLEVYTVEMTTEELGQLIDNVIEAVDKSKFGPVMEYGGTAMQPQKVVNQVAFPVFLQVLTTLLADVDTVTLIPDGPKSDLSLN